MKITIPDDLYTYDKFIKKFKSAAAKKAYIIALYGKLNTFINNISPKDSNYNEYDIQRFGEIKETIEDDIFQNDAQQEYEFGKSHSLTVYYNREMLNVNLSLLETSDERIKYLLKKISKLKNDESDSDNKDYGKTIRLFNELIESIKNGIWDEEQIYAQKNPSTIPYTSKNIFKGNTLEKRKSPNLKKNENISKIIKILAEENPTIRNAQKLACEIIGRKPNAFSRWKNYPRVDGQKVNLRQFENWQLNISPKEKRYLKKLIDDHHS